MPTKNLPANPDLAHLKHQAKDLLKGQKAHDAGANQRIREFHPRYRAATDAQIGSTRFSLSDAQFTIAREYGFASWAKLKASAEGGVQPDPNLPYHERIQDPIFRRGVDLLDAGDVDGLRSYLNVHPEVIRQKCFFSVNGYFGEPTLLEFAAENPIRHGTSPANIVVIVKTILESGARNDREAINKTLELLCSGKVARECGVQVALIDLLCDYGAMPDFAMWAALGHGEFAAVGELLRRGARLSLPIAAATGRLDETRRLLECAVPEERHRALAYASQFGHAGIVLQLLEAGEDPNRFNPVGCHSHSTTLHQAALHGFLEVAKLLVEHGASLTVRDLMWGSTPLGWAEHGEQAEVAEYLRRVASSDKHPK